MSSARPTRRSFRVGVGDDGGNGEGDVHSDGLGHGICPESNWLATRVPVPLRTENGPSCVDVGSESGLTRGGQSGSGERVGEESEYEPPSVARGRPMVVCASEGGDRGDGGGWRVHEQLDGQLLCSRLMRVALLGRRQVRVPTNSGPRELSA